MSKVRVAAKKLNNFVFSGRGLAVIGVLVGLFILRGCLGGKSEDSAYYIGRDARWPALTIMGKERNLTAFSDELVSEIGKIEGIGLYISSTASNQWSSLLAKDEVDGMLSTLLPTSQNQAGLIFSEPYLLTGPVLIVPQKSAVHSWNEISQKIIGVTPDSSSLFELEKDSTIRIRLYDNALKALSDLDENRIDGVILPAVIAYTYSRTFYPGRLKIATTPLTQEGVRLITLKNAKGQQLVNHFNNGLAKLKKNGTYEALILNWGLVDPSQLKDE